MKNIAIIGCGNLGISIAQGLIDSEELKPTQLFLTRRNTDRLSALKQAGVHVGSDNPAAADAADIIILAVKPYNVAKVIAEMGAHLKDKLIISLASGVEIQEIKDSMAQPARISRYAQHNKCQAKQGKPRQRAK